MLVPKKGETWGQMCFSGCAVGPTGVLKVMTLAHFVAGFDCLEPLYVPEPDVLRNVP